MCPALLVTVLLVFGASVGAARATAQDSKVHLRLVSIPLSIQRDDVLPITIAAIGDVPTDGAIVVSAYAPVQTRAQVAAIVNGALPNIVASSISKAASGLHRDDNGAFIVPIPTQSSKRVTNILRLKDPGLYPLSIELRDSDTGGTLAQLTTFVERLPDTPTVSSQVSVGWVFGVDSSPTAQANSTIVVGDQARTELTQLAGLLKQSTVPITAIIRPELLDGLRRGTSAADHALLDELASSVGTQHELLAETSVSIDPSAAAAAGMLKTFTDQLSLGETQTRQSLRSILAKRSTWYVPRGIDALGLALLRGVGVQHVFLGGQAVEAAPANTPTGEIGNVSVGPDQTVPALVADPTIQASLHTATDDPVLTAHQIAADLTALAIERDHELSTTATAPARGVIVAAGSVGDIDPTLLRDVFDLLGQSPHIALRTADDVLNELERGTAPEQMRNVTVVNPQPIDLRGVATEVGRLSGEIGSFAQMLPPTDTRPSTWRLLMNIYPADNLSTAERNAYSSQIDGDIADLRGAVTWPALGTITIGGRSSQIPFTLDNSSGIPLTVLLKLTSAKLTFPEGDKTETVDGKDSFVIPVRALSGADFPVTVELFTPDGRISLRPASTLTVRASVLTGLGQVATGALLVILASWWIQNFRRSRRRRRLVEVVAAGRHPVNGFGSAVPATKDDTTLIAVDSDSVLDS